MTLRPQKLAVWLTFLLFIGFAIHTNEGIFELFFPTVLAGTAFFFLACAEGFASGFNIRNARTLLPAFFLITLPLYCFVSGQSPQLGLFDAQSFLLLFATLLVFAHLDTGVAQGALIAMSVPLVWIAGRGIHQTAILSGYATGPWGDSNMYAGVVMAGGLVFLGLAAQVDSVTKKARYFTPLLVAGAALLIAAYFAHSRGAFAALTVSILVAGFAHRKSIKVSRKVVVAAAVLCLMVGCLSTAKKTVGQLADQPGGIAGGAVSSRVAMLESSWAMVKDHPLAGVGWGQWHLWYPAYRLPADVDSAGFHAHNDYLEAWAAGGPYGFLLMLSLPFLLAQGIGRVRNQAKDTLDESVTPPAVNPWYVASLTAGAGVLVVQASVNFMVHQAGVAVLAGALIGSLIGISRTNTPIHPMALPRKALLALSIPVISLLVGVNCLTMAATDALRAPLGTQAHYLPWIFDPQALRTLTALNPIGFDAPFVLGAEAQIHMVHDKTDAAKKASADQAIKYFELATSRNSRQPVTYYREAGVWASYPGLTREQRFEKLKPLLEEALRVNPAYLPAAKSYASVLLKMGRKQEALDVLDRAERTSTEGYAKLYNNLKAMVAAGTLGEQ
jgi:O-antigen ligase